jgi:hypothetical protein
VAVRWARGGSDLGAYRGLDLGAAGLLAWRGFAVDAAARVWRQPGLWLESGDPPEDGEAWGHGGELAVVSPALLRALPLRLGAAAAWKTDGYVPGERLDAGFTWRVGLGMHR